MSDQVLVNTQTLERKSVLLKDVQEFVTVKSLEDKKEWKGNGHVDFIANRSSGNKNTSSYKLDGAWQWRRQEQRHTIEADVAVEEKESVKSKDDYFLEYRYDHFFSDAWFMTSNTSYAQDRFKDLDRRLTIGLGVGYQFWDEVDSKLSLESSANYVAEKFIESDAEDKDKAAWRWGLDYRRNVLNKKTQFFHQHDGLVLAEGESKNIVKSKTGMRFLVNSSLSAVLQVDLDYDSQPTAETRKSDVTYSVGVGYKW